MSVRDLEQEIKNLEYKIDQWEKQNESDKTGIFNREKTIEKVKEQIKQKQRFLEIIKDEKVFEKVMAQIKDDKS